MKLVAPHECVGAYSKRLQGAEFWIRELMTLHLQCPTSKTKCFNKHSKLETHPSHNSHDLLRNKLGKYVFVFLPNLHKYISAIFQFRNTFRKILGLSLRSNSIFTPLLLIF